MPMDCCGLCGHGFGTPSTESTIDSARIFAECNEWEKSYNANEIVSGKPEDLNDIYFDIPWVWERLQRAIIRTQTGTPNKDDYALSGVSLNCWRWHYSQFQLTSNSRELVLGHATKWGERALSVFAGGPLTQTVYGSVAYPMHERCWAMMTRMLDVDLIENNLSLFAKVMYQRIKEIKLENKFLIDEQQYWIKPGRKYINLALQDPAKYAEVCEWKMERVDGCLDYAFAPRDPFNIPELASLLTDLEESRQKKLQKESQKKLERQAAAAQKSASIEAPKCKKIKTWKPRTPRCHRMALRPSTFDVCRIKAPTEIIIMIMDHLPDFRDIKTLMWVFPQWRYMVPQACWRDRFIKELALHEPAQDANALNWRYLYFHADQLLAKSHGWLFRRHVLGSLEKTKVAFLESVNRNPKRGPRRKRGFSLSKAKPRSKLN